MPDASSSAARRPDWTKRPRYVRDIETGAPVRVAYQIHARRQWIGGRGYCWATVVRVWNPERGATWEEAGAAAAPGEQFGLVLTPEEFEAGTRTAAELVEAGEGNAVLMSREEAREALTSGVGTERRVRFVKRTTGRVRAMRFRYAPGRIVADAGLLPVWDLDEGAPRTVNLDGVLA